MVPKPMPNLMLSKVQPQRHLLRSKLPLPVLIQLPSPRLKLRPKLRLRLRLPPNLEQELLLLPKLLLVPLLVLMPLLAPTHNILRNKNSTEVSPLMYFLKEPALNARLDRLLRCNILVPSHPMVKYSILLFQEDSQLLSRSVT